MDLWTCFNQEYIFERLNRHKTQNAPLTVWQERNSSQKIETSALIQTITKDKILFKLPASYFKMEYLFKDDLPLYFHNELNEVIFKRDNFTIAKDFLAIGFPFEVKFIEKRHIERLRYRYQDHQEVTFSRKSAGESTSQIFIANMINISVHGICFVAPIKDEKCFSKDQEVEIFKMTDQLLEKSCLGKISYVYHYEDVKNKGNKFAQIGVKFHEALDTIIHKSVASLLERKQKSLKGLDWEGFIGLTFEAQERILSNAKTSNQTLPLAIRLTENVEYIEKVKYMTPRMKMHFLKEISHDALAKALRICTKDVVFDLLNELPARLKEDILKKMEDSQMLNTIDIAMDTVCTYLRAKEKSGEFVLDASLFNQEV
jgi:hypothetical protein